MVEFKTKWTRKGLSGEWLGDTFVPSAVELRGEGERGAPNLHVRFEIRDGIPEVVSFHLDSTTSGRGVRTADLREWNLDGLAFNAFMHFAGIRDPNGSGTAMGGYGFSDEREYWQARGDVERASERRPGVSAGELEDVARIYRAHIETRPTEAVQKLGYSRRTAARRVQQARAAGLLPPTSRGKKGA